MPRTLTACAIALLAGAISAQGSGRGGSAIRKLTPRYPADLTTASFSPFVSSAGQSIRAGATAAQAADMDGDGNVDLWFFSHKNPGEIVVEMANTASLGRFHRMYSLSTPSFVHATTYRTKTSPVDQILLVDPSQEDPMLLHWNPKDPKKDPRIGNLGGSGSGWKIGKGMTEIAAADHSGDTHDDIVALQVVGPNQTVVHKLVMGTQKFNFLWVEDQLSISLPAKLENLHVLDIDGDGRTDFVASSPGIGLIACRDDRKGKFVVDQFWPTMGQSIRDIDVGDFDGDGLDDVAVAFDPGVVVLQKLGTTNPNPAGWVARVFLNPQGVGNLAACRMIDADARGTMLLLGFPRDGKNYVIHPHNPGALGLVQPWVETAPHGMSGPSVLGQSVLVTDVDNDDDPDILIQSPTGVEWMTLRNPAESYAPIRFVDVDKGAAPLSEGKKARRLEVTVDVPQAIINAGVLFMEMAFYVADPTSKNSKDPDYMYWGRVVPAIDTINQNATFTVFFDEDPVSFETRVKEYRRKRLAGIDTFFDVYPKNEWETIRGGPGQFLSIHGLDNRRRFESANGNEPEKPKGSTLGGKWVLRAKPPSTKGDVDLLPWE